MIRSQAWMLSRLVWLCAAGVVVTTPWCPAEPLSAPPALLMNCASPLQRLADAPLLLAVPNECACVGMDFVPPVPQVPGQRTIAPPAPMLAAPAPRVISQPLPVETQHRGLAGPAMGVAAEARPIPTAPQRLPVVSEPQSPPPVRVAARPNTGGSMLIDRLEPSSKSQPAMVPALNPTREIPAPSNFAQRAIEVSPPARSAMQAVNERAMGMAASGARLADRGALFSARSEFIQSLRVVTQALDAQSGEASHSQALADGLRAIEEADDFAPAGSQLEADLDLVSIIASHRTPILKDAQHANLTSLSALQQYYSFAQQRLATAAGQEPAASQALFGLGRLTTLTAQRSPDERRLHGPKAMVYFQAALAADARNHRAAHELGVLYAQFGQFEDAKRLLVMSANVSPTVETWHNLAVVHDRLGEADLAHKARYEMQLASRQAASRVTTSKGLNVEWVDASKFKEQTAAGPAPAVRAATRPAAGNSNPWLK